MSHKQTKCPSCGTILAQCRCIGPHETEFKLCDKCQQKADDSKLPTLTQLAKGDSRFMRYQDGKLWYTADWWDQTQPLPRRHEMEFSVEVGDPAATGTFHPFHKTVQLLRWARKELERRQGMVEVIASQKALGTQCMGCQAGWPYAADNLGPSQRHLVVGGYPGELVACTRDRDGA